MAGGVAEGLLPAAGSHPLAVAGAERITRSSSGRTRDGPLEHRSTQDHRRLPEGCRRAGGWLDGWMAGCRWPPLVPWRLLLRSASQARPRLWRFPLLKCRFQPCCLIPAACCCGAGLAWLTSAAAVVVAPDGKSSGSVWAYEGLGFRALQGRGVTLGTAVAQGAHRLLLFPPHRCSIRLS